MPVIKFEEKYRAEGLHALILQGEVYCLPDNVFIVPRSSLDYLDEAKIPYSLVKGKEHGFHSKKMAKALHDKASD
ncbi:hypothetical protein F4X33_12050 [Candidatus Poribacteria bacterium]|nr:hypothetical protein [Candidatus Poribacteria bacterium]